MLGEGFEAFAAAARHDHRQGAAGQAADVASGVIAGGVSHHIPKPDTLGKRLHLFSRPFFARLLHCNQCRH
jgi:hypothetical protein